MLICDKENYTCNFSNLSIYQKRLIGNKFFYDVGRLGGGGEGGGGGGE